MLRPIRPLVPVMVIRGGTSAHHVLEAILALTSNRAAASALSRGRCRQIDASWRGAPAVTITVIGVVIALAAASAAATTIGASTTIAHTAESAGATTCGRAASAPAPAIRTVSGWLRGR